MPLGIYYNSTAIKYFVKWVLQFKLYNDIIVVANTNESERGTVIMKSGFAKILISSMLCAVICVGAASCDSKDASVSPSDLNGVSSSASQEKLSELEALVQDDEFQEQVRALSQTYESKGMTLEVVAEGDSVVYKCIYTVNVDAAKSREELTEHLESKAFETSIDSVLRSFKAQVPQTRSVIVRYIDTNGNIIASKEYK